MHNVKRNFTKLYSKDCSDYCSSCIKMDTSTLFFHTHKATHSHNPPKHSPTYSFIIIVFCFLLSISVGLRWSISFTVIRSPGPGLRLGARLWTRPWSGAGTRLGSLLDVVLLLICRLGLAFLAAWLGSGPWLAAGTTAGITVGPGTTGAAARATGSAAGSALPAPAAGSRATAAARVWLAAFSGAIFN